MKIADLVNFYDSEFTKLIFEERKNIAGKPYYILYLHNTNKEPEYFSSAFLHYLPFYVHSKEQLDSFDDGSIKAELCTSSKRLWKTSPLIKSRKNEVNGIYGELFLDFYLKIVKKYKTFVVYANLVSYENNDEIKGFDNFTYYLNEEDIYLTLGEAKFVCSKSNAKTELLNDVDNHIKKSYFKDYSSFVFGKGSSEDDSHVIYDLLVRMNSKLNKDEKLSYLDLLKDENIKLHFVYFAIFTSNQFSTDDYDDFCNDLYKSFDDHVKREFPEFDISIDIVLVPIINKSLDIKNKIDEVCND